METKVSLRLLLDIVVFRFVVYLLSMIDLNQQFLCKIFYKNFRHINFSRQEHSHGSRSTPKMLRFQLIPSFIFPLQSKKRNLFFCTKSHILCNPMSRP